MTLAFGDPRLPARFWSKVQPYPTSGCWVWTAARKGLGYGCFGFEGRNWTTHRLMHSIATGEQPAVVMHRCDNPPCVNPDHLISGTHAANMADMMAKGRNAYGEGCGRTTIPDRVALEIIWLKNTNRSEREIAAQYGTSQGHVGELWRGKNRRDLHALPGVAAKIAEPIRRKRPTRCKRNHEFTEANTRTRPNGTRNCRTCAKGTHG
jgi:hypothetical protein